MRLHRLWSWFPADGITLFGAVFVKAGVPQYLIDHELVHVRQQHDVGYLRFYLRYVFSRRWRTLYESEAYVVNARAGVPVEKLAAVLAGPLYLWPCSKTQAATLIRSWLT